MQIGCCGDVKEVALPDSVLTGGRLWPNDYSYGAFHNFEGDIIASPEVWNMLCSTFWTFVGYNPRSGVITIPEGVKEIVASCFVNCTAKTYNLPASLERICCYAFRAGGTGYLENITFAEGSKLKAIDE